MTWIKTVSYDAARGRLKLLYDRVKGPDNNVDNIMMAHSLRPHTMEGHMQLYKQVLHNSANSLPTVLLETLAVYVSILNTCAYSLSHHFAGLSRLLDDRARAAAVRAALESDRPQDAFQGRELAALRYARKLTLNPASLAKADIEALQAVGFDDGEILEINQVVSYFNYANRMVMGLGVDTDGDILGLSPEDSEDGEDWRHA